MVAAHAELILLLTGLATAGSLALFVAPGPDDEGVVRAVAGQRASASPSPATGRC